MYSAGYHSITNVDYSSVCISTMRARHRDCPGMTWHQMDIRQLSFPDASFDVILEKATLDAIMVEEKSPWELSAQTACFIQKALTEVRYKSIWQFLSKCGSVSHQTCQETVPLSCLCVCVLRQRSDALNFKLNEESNVSAAAVLSHKFSAENNLNQRIHVSG